MDKFIALMETMLSSPIFWGVVALIALAFTLSGRLSVAAAAIFVWIAWAAAVFGVYRGELILRLDPLLRVLTLAACGSVLAIGAVLLNRWFAGSKAGQSQSGQTTLSSASSVSATLNQSPSASPTSSVPPSINPKHTPKTPIYEPPPKGPTPEPPRISPRIGTGPDAYKDIPDLQIVEWAIGESAQMEDLGKSGTDALSRGDSGQMSPQVRMRLFTQAFKDCCVEDLKDLRAELLRRLGPTGRDPREIEQWTMLFPETKYPVMSTLGREIPINPMIVGEYAPYLHKLAIQLKRKSVPRSAPKNLPFTEIQNQVDGQMPLQNVVTVEVPDRIDSGYLLFEFVDRFAMAGTDFAGSKSVFDVNLIENPDFRNYLSQLFANSGTSKQGFYALQIGTVPLSPDKPIHVAVRSNAGYVRAAKVTWFDE